MATVEWGENSNDEIGIVGEAQFELWCAQAKPPLVPNRVGRDRRGSDFVIEFDGPASSWRMEQVTSKVQVKTSAVAATSVDIKLDNFIRMASDLHPWFVVALALDDANEVRDAYVIHIDEKLVERVYRRVVALPAGDALNRRTLTVSWNATERLPQPSAREMSARLRAHIGPSMWGYISRKRRWHEALEMSRYVSGTCLLPATSRSEAIEMLVDLAIGELERIPVKSVRVSGLIPEELIDGDGFFAVHERRSLCTTIVTVGADGRGATIRCNTYHSRQAFSSLPDEFAKFRFESTLLSIVTSDSMSRQRWHLAPLRARYRLADLGATGNAVNLLGRPGARLTFELAGTRRTIEVAPSSAPPAWEPEAAQFAAACANALWLASFVGLDVNMEIDARMILAQSDRLGMLRGLLDSRAEIPEVRVLRVEPAGLGAEHGALVVCLGAILEEMVIVVCVGFVGKLDYPDRGATIAIATPRVRIMATRCVRETEWDASLGIAMIAGGVAKLESEGLAVVTIELPDDLVSSPSST
ncbi:MAG: hypothetical protein KF773_16890 [Deltaproteobacteria bacterium]|nr:hypothetical protein [Deltaproteobacteria bacterium]